MVVEIKDTTVILNSVTFVNSTILLDNATVRFNQTNGNVSLNNSVIHNYTGTFDIVASENSVVHTYDFVTIYFKDDADALVSIAGSVSDVLENRSFSARNNFTGWILPPSTFNFVTDFKYFNESVPFTSGNISLLRTHIPFWDSSIVVSPDLRNYSLLQNISNLSGISLTRAGVSISLSSANFSGLNLSERFSVSSTSTRMTVVSNISVFNLSFVSNFQGEVIVTYNGSYNDTYNSTGAVQTFTNLEPGVYVFSQVLDRFVLGEFSIVEWMLDGAVIRVFTKSAFISSDVIDSAFNLFLSEKLLNINSLNITNVFYYSGNLLNTNETKEIIN